MLSMRGTVAPGVRLVLLLAVAMIIPPVEGVADARVELAHVLEAIGRHVGPIDWPEQAETLPPNLTDIQAVGYGFRETMGGRVPGQRYNPCVPAIGVIIVHAGPYGAPATVRRELPVHPLEDRICTDDYRTYTRAYERFTMDTTAVETVYLSCAKAEPWVVPRTDAAFICGGVRYNFTGNARLLGFEPWPGVYIDFLYGTSGVITVTG